MKNLFLNILMIIVIIILYHLKVFDLVGSKGFAAFSYIFIIIVFVIALFVIGLPSNGKKK